MYNNETNEYIYEDYLFDALWLEDGDGNLYLVPEASIMAEIDGPDGEILDALNEECRENDGVLRDRTIQQFGLVEIPSHLKHWTPEEGYYHA